jgi:hypothetical protein
MRKYPLAAITKSNLRSSESPVDKVTPHSLESISRLSESTFNAVSLMAPAPMMHTRLDTRMGFPDIGANCSKSEKYKLKTMV